jgi:hypothetical protein
MSISDGRAMGIGAVMSSHRTKGEVNLLSQAFPGDPASSELRIPIGMSMPQVGFDQQVPR